MADFEKAVEKLLKVEGGFSNHDSTAGAVNWGITQRFLRSVRLPHSEESIRSMSKAQAKGMYKKYFWDELRLDEVVHQRLAETVLFAAVNIGSRRAVKLLQSSLHRIGRKVKIDGIVGQETLSAINSLDGDLPFALVVVYKERLRAFYESLAKRRPDLYGMYLAGWMKRLEVT